MSAGHIERARTLQQLGRHQEALDVLASAAQDEPSNPTVHSLRAISLAGLHDFDEALRVADVALQLAPSDPFSHFALGKIQFLKGDAPEARKTISAALEIEPNEADYHGLLAGTYLLEHRLTRALRAVDRALEIDPENRTCLLLKASVLRSKGRRSEASRLVDSLLRIDPHHASGLALHESLQRDAGATGVASLSLQANPQKAYVRNEALNDILGRSLVFGWLVTVDRIAMRVGAPLLLLISLVGGLLLLMLSMNGPPVNGLARASLRVAGWMYAAFLLVFVFGWCVGDVYLRFHASGRWLLSNLRRQGAEIVAAGLVIGGVVLVAAAMVRSRDWAFVGTGIVGGGLCISRSLAVFLRLASPLEFAASLAVTGGAMVAIATGVGLWDRTLTVSLAACGTAAWLARLAGWPRRESSSQRLRQ